MNTPSETNSETVPGSDDHTVPDLSIHRDIGAIPRKTVVDLTPPSEQDFDFIRHVRLTLRGRFAWLIGLGILTGALGAFAGWKLGHPMYVSTGLVRIANELPKVMTETDQNSPMQMYDTFMQSQRLLITSRYVLDLALQDPIWQTTGYPVPADPDTYFREHLTVTVTLRSEYIEIAVSDRDPGMAAAAVSSVVNAYAQLYDRQERQLEDARMGALNEKSGPLQQKIHALTDQISADSAEFGTNDLSAFYSAAADRVAKTSAALEDIRTAIAVAPEASSSGAAKPATQAAAMAIEQIAAMDPVMRDYVSDESRWEDELARLLTAYGEKHQSVILARESLDAARNRVNKYADSYREFHVATAQNLGDPGTTPVVTAGRSLASLQDSEVRLTKLLQQERSEMVRLGSKRMELDQLRSDLAQTNDEFTQVLRRTDALHSEDMLGGRLSITSAGQIPLGPERDPRRLAAAAGALVGAGLPATVLVLVSLLLKGKFRYSEETEKNLAEGIPLLGIVPMLNGNADAGEAMSNAAFSIHQIRVTLRAQTPRDRTSSLYLVTSAGQGEGKTSLTMSLGLSFATTRLRTLVIDCDLVGRQLTESLQASDLPGLHEAMACGSIRKKVRKAARNLYFLAAGQVTANDATSLSPDKLRPLLAQARKHFDVILVDTGPILGSVEAAVLAQEVDGVLFAITRDQRRALVERAVRRLATLDAPLEGFIFNRARVKDFETSSYGASSARSARANGTTVGDLPIPKTQFLVGFGPLVQAVAATISSRPVLVTAAPAVP